MAALATKIRFPVLTDLRIGNAPVRIDEVYPVNLPDLFADEELVITGRYRGAGRGPLSINGRRGGSAETFSPNVEFEDHELDNDYIPKIWASRKVGFLAQRLKLRGRDQETLDQLRETALRYGILSEYTSYLVQEPMEQPLAGRIAGRGAVQSPPPAASVGQSAVEASALQKLRREANTANAVDAASEALADESRVRNENTRTVGGRVFRNQKGTWTDTNKPRSTAMLTIKPFTPAYFALLRALPELESYWKVFTNVQISGRNLSVKLAPDGVSQLSAQEIANAVKEFRN